MKEPPDPPKTPPREELSEAEKLDEEWVKSYNDLKFCMTNINDQPDCQNRIDKYEAVNKQIAEFCSQPMNSNGQLCTIENVEVELRKQCSEKAKFFCFHDESGKIEQLDKSNIKTHIVGGKRYFVYGPDSKVKTKESECIVNGPKSKPDDFVKMDFWGCTPELNTCLDNIKTRPPIYKDIESGYRYSPKKPDGKADDDRELQSAPCDQN